MSEKNIKFIGTKEEIEHVYPLFSQLYSHLKEENYYNLYEDMIKRGYRMLQLEDEGKVVAVAGIIKLTNFCNGHYMYVYDLVTLDTERSKGHGEYLLRYINDYAKEQGCAYVELESALHRTAAHRFYEEKMNYDKFCYSFRYTL